MRPYFALNLIALVGVFHAKDLIMHRMDPTLFVSVPHGELSSELRQWIDAQDLSRLPTLNKDGALKLLNERGMPVKRSAVVTAFNSRELVSAIYSGKRLASEYDVVNWALARLRDSSQIAARAAGDLAE